MNKKIWWTTSIIAGILTLIYIYSIINKIEWLTSLISFLGILASLYGLLITYFQVKSVEAMAEATRQAVEENNASISKLISVEDITNIIREIDMVQHHIIDDKLEFCMIRLRDIREKVRVVIENSRIRDFSTCQEIEDMMPTLQTDYLSIQRVLHNKTRKIKKDDISKNLEQLNEYLIKIKTQLKQI